MQYVAADTDCLRSYSYIISLAQLENGSFVQHDLLTTYNSDSKFIKGRIQVMPAQKYVRFPDMILVFSEPIKKITVPMKLFDINCWSDNVHCTISANNPKALDRNKLFTIPITIFKNKKSEPLLVGMKWNGVDVCETKPEPHPEPEPEPTPEPEPEPTPEPEPNPECDKGK